MLDYSSQKEKREIPESHQKLVNERFDKVRKDPKRLLDWETAKETLN